MELVSTELVCVLSKDKNVFLNTKLAIQESIEYFCERNKYKYRILSTDKEPYFINIIIYTEDAKTNTRDYKKIIGEIFCN